jgi:hypothetical protein
MLDSAVIGKANTLAPNLAHTILEEGDFDALPIFADTLEDAGCNDPAILNACRDTSPTRSRNYPNLFHKFKLTACPHNILAMQPLLTQRAKQSNQALRNDHG